ncbi:MAG TPA: tetratricopeptide repeat protein [Nitrospiria bacterium]|nr:tetratricopeptide repeat protein [Nitrospiria bacterium]
MKRLSVLLLFVLPLAAGCHEKSPSTEPESANPIVPPFASESFEEPKDTELLQLHPVGGAQAPQLTVDPMAAIMDARERLNKNPKDLQALIFLGNANFDIQRYQEAADLYQQALALNSDNAQARTDRATALYRLGHPREAVEELNLALESDDHHENALYNLGIIKLDAFNDRDGAIAAWTQLKGITRDQQLIADLDKRIAAARQAPSHPAAASGGTAPASPAASVPSAPPAAHTGTVLQLPKDHPQ